MDTNNHPNIAGALTFPAPDPNEQPIVTQPRQPTTLQGLLKFAMEATKQEDAPGVSQLGPIDEERRKFLEEALKSLTVDVIEVLQKAIAVLKDPNIIHSIQFGDPLPEEVETSFNNILEFVDNIDTANDFYKLGGFAIFPVCYGSENDLVRSRTSAVLAELCQNNKYCQSKVFECGLLNVLLNLMQTERGEALVKCISALSCACREYPPACDELVDQGGCITLSMSLAAPELSVRTKAAFFIRYLCANHTRAKQIFIEANIVTTIAEQVKKGHNPSTEHLLSILVALIADSDPKVMDKFKSSQLGLKKILQEHLKSSELQDDSFLEEKEYCQLLLDKVFDVNDFVVNGDSTVR